MHCLEIPTWRLWRYFSVVFTEVWLRIRLK
jgi:hypothetical protein